uniref:Uncharacterized protein n=1 Tax=Magallana gigas TaxID=29159 RepID=K1QYD3_MAGGI
MNVFLLSIHVAPANITSHCNVDDAFKPTAIETIVLVKKGYIEYAAQKCPTPFLGSFNYTFKNSSTTYCDSKNGGVAYCAYSTSVGSTYYITMVNADSTVDFTTTFRFTCYALNSSDGFVYASDNKGACVPEQDPQTKLATGTGTLILSARAFKSASSQKNSNSYIGIVIGAIAGTLVLAAAVLVFGTLLYRKCKARIFPHEHREDDL